MKTTLIFAFLCGFASTALAQTPDSWGKKADAPDQLYNLGSGTVGDRIYVFGGAMGNQTREYNPLSDTWTAKASIADVAFVGQMGSAAFRGRVYCLGGWAQSADLSFYAPEQWVFEFNVAANSWTRIADLQKVRLDCAVVGTRDRLYAFGGDADPGSGSVEAYDPASNTWSYSTPMPQPLSVPSAALIAGKIYLAGGYGGPLGLTQPGTYSFDPAIQTWATLTSMPGTGKFASATAVLKRHLYLFGGDDDAEPNRTKELSTYEYNPATDQWVTRATLLDYLTGGKAGVVQGSAYAFGNSDYAALRQRVQVYTPPDFGASPTNPTGLGQHLPGEALLAPGATVAGSTIVLEGSTFDPDGPQVGLDVEVIPTTETFTGIPNASSTGTLSVTVTLAPGSYIWRARSFDTNGNESAWVDFAATSPSFTLTTVVPTPTPTPAPAPVGQTEASTSSKKASGCGQSATSNGSTLGILLAAILLGVAFGRRGLAVTVWALIATAASAQSYDSWTEKARMGTRRAGHASAEAGGKLYVYGGQDIFFYYTTCIDVYDPIGNTWRTLANTGNRDELWLYTTGVHLNGKLYQFGGAGPYGIDGAVWQYDIASDSWKRYADMPVQLYMMRAAIVGNRIFVTGGRTASAAVGVSSTYEYDPTRDSWTSRASMPVGVMNHHVAAISGKIYSAGGLISIGNTNVRTDATQEYDPATDQWTLRQPMPISKQGGGCAAANNKLFLMGGGGNGTYGRTQVYEYSVRSNRWNERAAMPFIGGSLMAASPIQVDGQTVILQTGGFTGYSEDPTDWMTWIYTPPDPGRPPSTPTGLFMKDPLGRSIAEGGLSATTITLGATLADPDSQVFIEVEVAPQGQPFTGIATASAGPFAPGVGTVTVTRLESGSWKWRTRAMDVDDNQSAWADFGDPAISDFVVDATAPTGCSGLSPLSDALVEDPRSGPVHFTWTAATDDRAGAITYELQVANDAAFASIYRTQSEIAATGTSLNLAVNRNTDAYYWRVRAYDAAGNVSVWSAPLLFHVYWNDLADHGAGDAVKACGMSTPGSGEAGVVLIIALLLLGRVRFN